MMMRKYEFTSVFAQELTGYLAFKQSMGCYGASRIWYLRSFDTYCTEHAVTAFDQQAIEGWVIFKKSSQPGSSPSWMSYISDFGRWMLTHALALRMRTCLPSPGKVGSPAPSPTC